MSQYNEGIKSFKAGGAVNKYRRVKLDSNGDVVHAGVDEVGIGTVEDFDNASNAAASGDHVSVRLWGAPGTRKIVAEAAVTARMKLYCGAAGKFDDDQADGPALLLALEAATADGDIIEAAELDLKTGSAVLYANVADSASITNTTTETDFDKKRTIDGNILKKGDVLEIIARANMVATNGTDTFNLKVYVATEEIAATGALDVANGDQAYIHAFVVVRDVGASGKLSASGIAKIGGASAVPTVIREDQSSEDLSGSIAVKATGTWSVANAGNDAVLEDFIVIHHKQ